MIKSYEANHWHKVFILIPRQIFTVETKADGTKHVSSCWRCFCFVERRFSIVRGVFSGVEYRIIYKNIHKRCIQNCFKPGCEAPIPLNLEGLRRVTRE